MEEPTHELTVAELVRRLRREPVDLGPGRASKVVSDAMRANISGGRVTRLGRGRYALAPIPDTTRRRMRRRVLGIRSGLPLDQRDGRAPRPEPGDVAA
ncbi:MAG: hypothetical protein S0880_32060 [Actinomycetota bacterium]|nr:hypothetical protein [Actinomycetota bacterium]